MIDFTDLKRFYTSRTIHVPAMIPMMTKETVVTRFIPLLKWNVIASCTILESSCVLTNHLGYLKVKHNSLIMTIRTVICQQQPKKSNLPDGTVFR